MASHVIAELQLVIPFPSYIPRARGIHAVAKFGTVLKAKCSLDEDELVQAAANRVGIPKATFVRWCVVEAAKEIMK